jgi:putative endonuclease
MLHQWIEKLQHLFTGSTGDDEAARARAKGKDPLGIRGENVAAKHLQKLGYRIYGRNVKTPVGEIDIIARDGKTLVFCEVKTRAYDEPTPEEQIDSVKMHQLTKAAKFYLSRYGGSPPPARFDVVAIVWPQGQQPVIRHIPNAFEPTF